MKVCGIPLEGHNVGTFHELWRAHERGLFVEIERKSWSGNTPPPASWNCRFEGEAWVRLVVEGTAEQARDALEAAVLKNFGHKLAFLRWLLEQA